MLVVIPVCAKDEALVLKNLDWIAELDGRIEATALIAYPIGFDAQAVIEKAKNLFGWFLILGYDEWRGDPKWPNPQNWAWQAIARHMATMKESWLWWEADSTPLIKGWYDAIRCEYEQAKKPFMGCIMDHNQLSLPVGFGNTEHMNGVGVYPHNVQEYSTKAMLCRAAPFDIVLWPDIQMRTHYANHIIQHHCHKNGDSTHFPDQASVEAIVRPGVVLFHRCKDGSLIDRLREAKPKGLLKSFFAKPWIPPQKKTVVPILCHLDASSGYGIFASQMTQELLKLDYEVELFPSSYNEIHGNLPTDVKVRIRKTPNNHPWSLIMFPAVIQPANLVLGKQEYAFFSMFEASRLTSTVDPRYTKAIQAFNHCKLVITPNSWNASGFSSCGVDTPIRIVPMGFDPDIFPVTPNHVNDDIVFGTAAKTASGGIRKGFSIVVEAFRLAFPREKHVRLKVKSFPEDPKIETHGDTRIDVLQEYIDQSALVDWYRSINVFVSGSAAEGWGRHQHEAMAMGRPVIGIDFGGVAEFFSNENGYAVDFTLVPGEGIYRGMGVYGKPDVRSMAEQMKRAFDDRKELKEKTFLCAKSARRFTLRHSAERLIATLKDFKFPV